jgi:pimeloyl-ACP methyl ester carboxylesterase
LWPGVGAAEPAAAARTSGDRTRIVQTVASLLDSAGAARGAARALGGGWTPERVDGAVTVELALRLLERAGSRPDGVILVNGPGLRDRFVRALQRVSAPVDIGDRPRELELRRAR